MVAPLLNVASMLTVGLTPPIVLISHEKAQGLRVEWDVEKSVTPEPDRATIRIYNLARVSRLALEAAVGLPAPIVVQLSVGWGLVPELMFTGQAWRIQPEVKRGMGVVTEIEAGDGVEVRDTPPSGGAWVGQTAAVAVALLVTAMGLVPSASALETINTRAAELPIQAWPRTGDKEPRDDLDELMATLGLAWGVKDGFFVVYRAGLRNDLAPSLLNPLSGLLNAHTIDDGGVEFEALTQARFVPGLQVAIQVPGPTGTGLPFVPLGGPLRVESVRFSGSSEGPSIMRGVARRVALI